MADTVSDAAAPQAPPPAFADPSKTAAEIFWTRLGVIGSLATPIVVVVIGYLLSGRVDETMKVRELELGNIKELQPLVAQVEKATTDKDARAGTAAMSAFGPFAVPPLLLLLRSGSPIVERAAEEGLLNVGAAQPDPVCRQMHLILANRTQLYSWENQATAMRLMGELGCENATTDVEGFSRMLSASGLKQYQNYVRDDPRPDVSSLAKLTCQIELTQSQLRGSGTVPCVN